MRSESTEIPFLQLSLRQVVHPGDLRREGPATVAVPEKDQDLFVPKRHTLKSAQPPTLMQRALFLSTVNGLALASGYVLEAIPYAMPVGAALGLGALSLLLRNGDGLDALAGDNAYPAPFNLTRPHLLAILSPMLSYAGGIALASGWTPNSMACLAGAFSLQMAFVTRPAA